MEDFGDEHRPVRLLIVLDDGEQPERATDDVMIDDTIQRALDRSLGVGKGTGIGTVLNTGTVIGTGSNVFGGAMPPTFVATTFVKGSVPYFLTVFATPPISAPPE